MVLITDIRTPLLIISVALTHFAFVWLVPGPKGSTRRKVRRCAEPFVVGLVTYFVLVSLLTANLPLLPYFVAALKWLGPRLALVLLVAAPFYLRADYCPECDRFRALREVIVSSKYKEAVKVKIGYKYRYEETYHQACEFCNYTSTKATRQVLKNE